MATVITNLLSAIPWLGKSLVELKDIIKYKNIYYNYIKYKIVLCKYYNIVILDTIGKISPYAIKRGWKEKVDKDVFSNIPYSFLSMLIGFIDGDGYIGITKSKKDYIKINLVISLDIKDISILYYIQSILKIGIIKTYPKSGNKNTCKLVIYKTDLQVFLFPLFIKNKLFFLTKIRNEQYCKALYIMKNDIKLFSDIPNKNFSNLDFVITNSKDIVKLQFFSNWIVGFTVAEGSFVLKINKDASFQLKQRKEAMLFEAIKLKFNSKRKIYYDKNNLYCQLSMSSKKDVQNVVNFFSFSGNHPLIGLKLLSYQKWILYLRGSKRYGKLILPN